MYDLFRSFFYNEVNVIHFETPYTLFNSQLSLQRRKYHSTGSAKMSS